MKIGILHRSLHTARGAEKMVIDLCSGKYRLKPAGFELIGPTHDNIGDKKVE